MGKYLKKFENYAEYEEAKQNLILPNVSLCAQENEVHYSPVPPMNVITYQASGKLTETTSAGRPTDGFKTDAFSGSSGQRLTMKSHTFENGVGAIEFDGDIASIGQFAFYGCSGLTSVTIPNSVTSIGGNAFANCTSLTSLTIPNSVTSIGNLAFYQCTSLTSINIPDSVTSIGSNAFATCTSLTSINVNSGNTVYDSRNNCNAIIETETNTLILGCKTTIIPNSVTSIGVSAFSGCSGLTSVNIPDSVTSIGVSAFSGCRGLTSVTIPNSVTSIGDSAFSSCSGLTSCTLGNSVTSIGNMAFYNCNRLTSCTIGNGVTSIGARAFYSCSGLTSVTIGNGVTSIGSYAFAGCSSLSTITSYIMNAPNVNSGTFGVKNGGTLYVPIGSSGYDTWMNNQGNLGQYGWTKVEQ